MPRPPRTAVSLSKEMRLDAAIAHDEEEQHASVWIQRCWRGASRRRELWSVWSARNEGAQRAASRIQSRWRGVVSRGSTARRWRALEASAASQISALYRGWIGRREGTRARVLEATTAASALQRCYRGRLGKRLYELAKAEDKRRRATTVQRVWRGRGSRRIARRLACRDEEGASPTAATWMAGMHAAHAALANSEYEVAVELLARCRVARVDAATSYASAVALQVAWPRFSKYQQRRPDLLDEALHHAKEARKADPSGESYDFWRRVYWLRRDDALARCVRAVTAHTVRGDPCVPKRADSKPERRALARLVKTCRSLYARAAAADPCGARPEIRECVAVFEALYATRSTRMSKTRTCTTRDKTTWLLQILRAGAKLVCRATELGGRRDLPDVVVHQSELAELQVATRQPVAEYVLSQLVVVRAGSFWRLALPGLFRLRERRAALAARAACATRLARTYRVFDQRALYKRTAFRLRQKDVQAAKLAARRAAAHLHRLELHRLVSKAQAATRGTIVRGRRIASIVYAAVMLIQSKARAVATRVKLAEDARRRLEGAQTTFVCARGHALPSGDHLLVTVTRSGRNFKFAGLDLETCVVHLGFFYQNQIDALLATYNRDAVDPIRHYQHLRIVDLLFDRLDLVTPLQGIPTADFSTTTKLHPAALLVLSPDHARRFAPPGAQQKRALDRGLADTRTLLRRHTAKLESRRKARRARGLPPIPDYPAADPHSQEGRVAQARFKMRLYNDVSFVKAVAAKRR